MKVKVRPEAEAEWLALPKREREAMRNAWRKLRAGGDQLGHPHTSAVKSATGTLRELRPRGGHSPWRAFYRRVGDTLVVAAVGPLTGAASRGRWHWPRSGWPTRSKGSEQGTAVGRSVG